MVGADKLDQLRPHVLDRNGEIDQAGGDCGIRHIRMLGAEAVADLREGNPAALFDRLDAKRAVGIPSGENDAAGELTDIDRQRAHEDVDRLALAASIVFAQGQPSVLDTKNGIGRHHIDVVDIDGHGVGGDPHRQIRIAAHDLMKETFPVGTEMGHDDQREPRLWRQTAKKSFKRFDAAS